MQTVLVAVNDFWWPNGDEAASRRFVKKNRVCRGLERHGFRAEFCPPGPAARDADLVFFGAFGTRHGSTLRPADFPRALKIQNCDENLHGFPEFAAALAMRPECDFSFSYDHTTATNFRMTGVRALADLPALRDPRLSPAAAKTGFACFLYSYSPAEGKPEGVRLRDEFFQRLNALRPVASGGEAMNNIGRVIPGEETGAFLASHKFFLAMENSIQPGYVTEKILNAYFHGAVPVYCGAPDVEGDFDNRTFLRYTGDNFEEVVDAMFAIDADPAAYDAMIRRPKLPASPRPEFIEGALEERIAAIAAALRSRIGA
jgi:hypothetical protein